MEELVPNQGYSDILLIKIGHISEWETAATLKLHSGHNQKNEIN